MILAGANVIFEAMRAQGNPRARGAIADGLVAATALQHDLTRMTRNTRDLGLTGARLINPWED